MLAGRLQRRTTTLATWMEDAFRVRLHLPSAPRSGAALCQELRASSRRSHRPTGQPKRQERTQNWIKLGGNVSAGIISERNYRVAIHHELTIFPGREIIFCRQGREETRQL